MGKTTTNSVVISESSLTQLNHQSVDKYNSDAHHSETIDEVIQRFKRDFDVIQSDATHLLLDLDTPEAFQTFLRERANVESLTGKWVDVVWWKSKSGNKHIYITLPRSMEPGQRFAFQAALGSDPIREVLSLRRLKNGETEPSILFKPRSQ